ncbi:MAG: hydrogenase small subunit [Deltaproteobacteria bacterium]|nr:hydrogenase small subunit [Deltaproteobacteria bacterium]
MIKRRQFLKLAASMGAAFGLSGFSPLVSAALKSIDADKIPKLIYLQGLSCSGCSVSLLQAQSPQPLDMITNYSQLVFHGDLSAASGRRALDVIDEFIAGRAGEYFLAVEGAIPEKMPEACKFGDHTFAAYLEKAARTMAGVVAIGSCATFGGIPAAEGNLTGAIGLPEFYRKRQLKPLMLTIPGCSVHPDWVWHTISHIVKVGIPKLNQYGSPELFFSSKVHNNCPRYHYFQEEIMAENLGDEGCLFKVGCLGPDTLADCPTRWWNGGQTWCIDANAPCIGCTAPIFARKKDFPFYRNKHSG